MCLTNDQGIAVGEFDSVIHVDYHSIQMNMKRRGDIIMAARNKRKYIMDDVVSLLADEFKSSILVTPPRSAGEQEPLQKGLSPLPQGLNDLYNLQMQTFDKKQKYYQAQKTFISWLSQAQNKVDSLRSDSFKRMDVDNQLCELSAFHNEVCKKSGEFKNLCTLGEMFLSVCHVDKENVKHELAAIKAQWDKLNGSVHMGGWKRHISCLNVSEQLDDLVPSVDKLASHDLDGAAGPQDAESTPSKHLERNWLGTKW